MYEPGLERSVGPSFMYEPGAQRVVLVAVSQSFQLTALALSLKTIPYHTHRPETCLILRHKLLSPPLINVRQNSYQSLVRLLVLHFLPKTKVDQPCPFLQYHRDGLTLILP